MRLPFATAAPSATAVRLTDVLETLDAAAVRRWCADGVAALERHQGEINRLNVYPVPDGDTGTNLLLTLSAALRALDTPETPLPGDPVPDEPAHGRVLRAMAYGALLGARGNSGAILAQILRGLADRLAPTRTVRGRAVAEALRAAVTAAYAAVAEPVEGTVLSVINAAAAAAEQADSDDLATVVRAAAAGATDALTRTPEQLPVLARAGVVDAGGLGLCVLLRTLAAVVTGEPAPPLDAVLPRPAARPAPDVAGPARLPTGSEGGGIGHAYELQFLLDADEAAVERLRRTLGSIGDSLVVVSAGQRGGGRSTWKVHVHVNDIGAAVEAAVAAGRPYRIEVTRFEDQAPASAEAATGQPAPDAEPAADRRGAVAVASGDGLAELFRAEGAVVVGSDPDVDDLVNAIRSTGAVRVVVLPDNPRTQAVANAAAVQARSLGVKVSVVPTHSPVQALAALAVRDPSRSFEDDVIAMAEAAGACRYAEVRRASQQALTVAGPVQPGEVVALVEGEVILVGKDLSHTCQELLDRMLGGGGELVTLLLGADAPPGLAEQLPAHLARHWPFVEVHCYHGGQPDSPLLVGVE